MSPQDVTATAATATTPTDVVTGVPKADASLSDPTAPVTVTKSSDPSMKDSAKPQEGDGEVGDTVDESNGADVDDSWYGEGPPEEVKNLVHDKLGAEVSTLFTKACMQLNGSGDNVPHVLVATSTFVTALKRVPEEMQMTGAFGEISLAYGRALVRYVELEGTGSSAVAAKIVKALQSAVSGGHVAADSAEDPNMADADMEDDEDGEDDTGKDGDDDEDLESAWTQLEVARVIFSQQGWKEREAECRYTLGELLLACDEGKQSGEEFASAANLFSDTHRQAECHYKRYLAFRNADRSTAIDALKEAVRIYEGTGSSGDVLTDMKAELNDMVEAGDEGAAAKATAILQQQPTEVQVVRPKRKRDVSTEKTLDGLQGGQDTSAKDAVATKNTDLESNGKKARVNADAQGPKEETKDGA